MRAGEGMEEREALRAKEYKQHKSRLRAALFKYKDGDTDALEAKGALLLAAPKPPPYEDVA